MEGKNTLLLVLWEQRTEEREQSWKDPSHSDIWDRERKRKSCGFVFVIRINC